MRQLIAIAVFLSGCAGQSIVTTKQGCNIDPLVSSTNEQKCVFTAIATRCNAIDECLLHCWNDEAGEGIGGGCHHLCRSDAKSDWTPPAEADHCGGK